MWCKTRWYTDTVINGEASPSMLRQSMADTSNDEQAVYNYIRGERSLAGLATSRRVT